MRSLYMDMAGQGRLSGKASRIFFCPGCLSILTTSPPPWTDGGSPCRNGIAIAEKACSWTSPPRTTTGWRPFGSTTATPGARPRFARVAAAPYIFTPCAKAPSLLGALPPDGQCDRPPALFISHPGCPRPLPPPRLPGPRSAIPLPGDQGGFSGGFS